MNVLWDFRTSGEQNRKDFIYFVIVALWSSAPQCLLRWSFDHVTRSRLQVAPWPSSVALKATHRQLSSGKKKEARYNFFSDVFQWFMNILFYSGRRFLGLWGTLCFNGNPRLTISTAAGDNIFHLPPPPMSLYRTLRLECSGKRKTKEEINGCSKGGHEVCWCQTWS